MKTVFQRVKEERKRQDKLWGEQNHHPIAWISILTEEVGEAAKESNDLYFRNKGKGEQSLFPVETLQAVRIEKLKEELIQVAAVAIQAVESIERQGNALL